MSESQQAATSSSPSSKISPALLQELEQNDAADILVALNSDNSYPLSTVNATEFTTREERLNAVSTALRDHAAREQKEILEFLKSQNSDLEIESMWINNQIFVKCVGKQLVERLALREDVKEIKENAKIVLDDPVVADPAEPDPEATSEAVLNTTNVNINNDE